MKAWVAAVTLLSLTAAAPASGNSIFVPEAVFDFEPPVTATAPPDINGPGGYGPSSPLVQTDNGLSMTLSRIGEPNYDVKELDARFPTVFALGALDPHNADPTTNDGANCAGITDPGCLSFVADFNLAFSTVEVQFFHLGSPMYELELLPISSPGNFESTVDATATAFVDGDPNSTLSVAVGTDGVISVGCDRNECGQDIDFNPHYVTVRISATEGELFQTLLFRGFATVDGSGITNNTVYSDNIAVGGVIPEPTTAALVGFGAASVIALARRKRE